MTEVLIITPVADEDLDRIAAVDTRLKVVDGRGLFDNEIRETWSRWTVQRYLRSHKSRPSTGRERDQLLATAEIILGGWPYPMTLCSRAPCLRWYHQLPAGASNLLRSDLWGSHVVVTTSRGYGNTRAMAEYVLASFLYFSRDLYRACNDQRFHKSERATYRPVLLQGKTAGIIGAGGIGKEVAKLCAGAGCGPPWPYSTMYA